MRRNSGQSGFSQDNVNAGKEAERLTIPHPIVHDATLPPLRPQHDLSDMTVSPDVMGDCLPNIVSTISSSKGKRCAKAAPYGGAGLMCAFASQIARPPRLEDSTKIPQLDHDRIRIPRFDRTRNRAVLRAFHPTTKIAAAFAVGARGEFAGAGVEIEGDRFSGEHHREQLACAIAVRQRDFDLFRQARQHGGVDLIATVGGGEQEHRLRLRGNAVHFLQQLADNFGEDRVRLSAACGSDDVDLVDEQQRWRRFARALEDFAHFLAALAEKALFDVGGGDGDEAHPGFVGQGARDLGLTGAGWPVQQQAAWYADPAFTESVGVLQQAGGGFQFFQGRFRQDQRVPARTAVGRGGTLFAHRGGECGQRVVTDRRLRAVFAYDALGEAAEVAAGHALGQRFGLRRQRRRNAQTREFLGEDVQPLKSAWQADFELVFEAR